MSSTVELLYEQYYEMCAISQRLENIKEDLNNVWLGDLSKLKKLQSKAEECDKKTKSIKQRLDQVLKENLLEIYRDSDIFMKISQMAAKNCENAEDILNKIEEKNIFGNKFNEVMESLIVNAASLASFMIKKISGRLPPNLQKYLPE
ncbi:MAG: hypothetical protein KME54_26495 [Tolypothrix brevis GSE-NOS-MK-07-07A]|jgi:ElaB/YqjD/DUF883 family membrane-anchored ribosome-binding protein|nr:hypothetical protein [Tolypothrix brevis GSE-NOS-MK-07-07A]